MAATAAGVFRRTPVERSDQRVAWERTDQAFFAAGACHILAWACRDARPGTAVGIAGLVKAGDAHPSHVYATWNGWAFDFSGWNPEGELLRVNADFEGADLAIVAITVGPAEFCARHRHRMPREYWRDPRPRAQAYLQRFPMPGTSAGTRPGTPIGAPGSAADAFLE